MTTRSTIEHSAHIPPPDGLTFEDVYQALLTDDETIIEETVIQALEDLSDAGFLLSVVYDDETIYSGRPSLRWAEFCQLVNPLHKQILRMFSVEDPATWMLLKNTQTGKLRKLIGDTRPLVESAQRPDSKVKPVIIVYAANDRDLAVYTREDFIDQFPENTVEVTLLSNNGGTITFETIRTKIDAYAGDNDNTYGVPILLVLANSKQNEKVVKILHHIVKKATRGSHLRYATYFDEADQTYPNVRDLTVSVEPHTSTTLGAFVATDIRWRLRVGWLSATDGDLLISGDYPECETAPVLDSDQDDPNYRAIHTVDATVHKVAHPGNKSHNDYATSLLDGNLEHFFGKYRTKVGLLCYRKVIINGDMKIANMKDIAKDLVRRGAFAMTFNKHGVTVYFSESHTKEYKAKGRFGKLLFYIYKMNRLHTRPLFVIGRRKVDRGLGFHWAPRGDGHLDSIKGQDGILPPTGIDSLIWTDVILGRIPDKVTAVQKAGRGAGVIAHCPHFPTDGIHYWTTSETAAIIVTHNKRVDQMNENSAGRTSLQAMEVAKREVPDVVPVQQTPLPPHRLYETRETAKKACRILGYQWNNNLRFDDDGIRYKTSLNTRSEVVTVSQVKAKLRGAYGGGGAHRTMFPCYVDTNDASTLRFLIVLRAETPGELILKLDVECPQADDTQEPQ